LQILDRCGVIKLSDEQDGSGAKFTALCHVHSLGMKAPDGCKIPVASSNHQVFHSDDYIKGLERDDISRKLSSARDKVMRKYGNERVEEK
jgi:hypothetical protein